MYNRAASDVYNIVSLCLEFDGKTNVATLAIIFHTCAKSQQIFNRIYGPKVLADLFIEIFGAAKNSDPAPIMFNINTYMEIGDWLP